MAAPQRFLSVAVVALLVAEVTPYNPLLTYALRFKKVTMFPNITGEYSVDQYKDKQYMNGKIAINSNETVDSVVVYFNRCNPEGYDCEYFQTWKLLDICSKLKDKNQIWSDWYGAFHPPMICPVNKVHYEVRNATFDINKVVKWYPDVTNYYWKVVQKLYAGNTFVGGYTLEVSAIGYRKKKKNLLDVLPNIDI